jgi:hypothetical protein
VQQQNGWPGAAVRGSLPRLHRSSTGQTLRTSRLPMSLRGAALVYGPGHADRVALDARPRRSPCRGGYAGSPCHGRSTRRASQESSAFPSAPHRHPNSMPGWWSGSAVHVKCVTFVSTAVDRCAALAGEQDGRLIEATVQVATAAVLGGEGAMSSADAHAVWVHRECVSTMPAELRGST